MRRSWRVSPRRPRRAPDVVALGLAIAMAAVEERAGGAGQWRTRGRRHARRGARSEGWTSSRGTECVRPSEEDGDRARHLVGHALGDRKTPTGCRRGRRRRRSPAEPKAWLRGGEVRLRSPEGAHVTRSVYRRGSSRGGSPLGSDTFADGNTGPVAAAAGLRDEQRPTGRQRHVEPRITVVLVDRCRGRFDPHRVPAA